MRAVAAFCLSGRGPFWIWGKATCDFEVVHFGEVVLADFLRQAEVQLVEPVGADPLEKVDPPRKWQQEHRQLLPPINPPFHNVNPHCVNTVIMVRKLKHHEQKLLKKTDFITYKQDNGHRDHNVIRRYMIQKPEDYNKYNRLCGVSTL